MAKILVIGGGLSGLAAAFRIRQAMPGADITVLESSTHPGGFIGTMDRDGFRVERGPNGLFDANPEGLNLARDVGLGDSLIMSSEESRKNRYLFLNEKLQKMPGSPLSLLTNRILSFRGRLSLLREPFRNRRTSPDDETIAEFARRRFGPEAAETFIDALVTGIYAGDPERLSVRSCFPRLVKYEAEAGSVLRGVLRMRKQKKREARSKGEPAPGPQKLWSFRLGLKVLIQALAKSLGSSLQTGVNVTRIQRNEFGWIVRGDGQDTWTADAVVLTCPAYRQAEILADLDAGMSRELESIPYNRIAVVALGYRRNQVSGPQDGFGYLSPQNQKRNVLGVQWCSSIYPERAPEGCVLWRALCGGVKRGEVAMYPDGELLQVVQREMQTTMGVSGGPVFSEIVRWPQAIPQYGLGHADRVMRIDAATAKYPGLFLGGNALRGVAMADCAESGRRIAEQVKRYFQPAGESASV